MYAMGPAKYDLSSLLAIARMLRIGRVSFRRGGARRVAGGRLGFVGREREEYLFKAHAHRPELEQPPAARHDRPRQLAADVLAVLAVDFEADNAVALIGRLDAGHAGHLAQHRPGVAAAGVHLDV